MKKQMNDKYLRLYSTSKLVRGKDKGAAYILDEGRIEIVPLALIDCVELLYKHSIGESEKLVSSKDIFKEYLEFILSKKIGFITEDPDRIKNMGEYYETPSHIFLSCIELNSNVTFNLKKFIEELDNLLCKHIELRLLHDNISTSQLTTILDHFEGTTIRSIEIYIKDISYECLEELPNIIERYKKISYVTLFSMIENKTDKDIIFSTKKYNEIISSHFNEKKLFINTRYFTESKKYNPFYNKKVSINERGIIKNNLICEKSFGEYCPMNNSLQQLINNPEFIKYWKIGPDKIENLKISELRYAIFPSSEIVEQNGKYYLKEYQQLR